MPIKPRLHSHDKPGTVYNLSEVTVGHGRAWLDQSIGCWVVALCRFNDLGASVFLADAAEPVPQGEYYNEANPLSIIPPGLKFEMDIIDFEGEHGRLVLQHHLPDGQINTLN